MQCFAPAYPNKQRGGPTRQPRAGQTNPMPEVIVYRTPARHRQRQTDDITMISSLRGHQDKKREGGRKGAGLRPKPRSPTKGEGTEGKSHGPVQCGPGP